MIKLRLECKPEDIEKTVKSLEKEFDIISVSKPYKNRNSILVRVYVEADHKE